VARWGSATPTEVTYSAAMEQPQFWYNLRTGTVESEYDKSQGKDLMGPYPSQSDAELALAKAQRRTEEWDEEDRRWREGDDA
jgi:hypothetical protein